MGSQAEDEGRVLRFVGGTFDSTPLSLSLRHAKELSAFQRLVDSAAVTQYAESNPMKRRVPRAQILQDVSLTFATIESGSTAIPLVPPSSPGRLFEQRGVVWAAVDGAFELLAKAFFRIDLDKLTGECLDAMKGFGASFASDEALEFEWAGRPIHYGMEQRKLFIQQLDGSRFDSTLIGWVKMLDVGGRFVLVMP
jgi:hypothetical protein